jgi:hypothetical protein
MKKSSSEGQLDGLTDSSNFKRFCIRKWLDQNKEKYSLRTIMETYDMAQVILDIIDDPDSTSMTESVIWDNISVGTTWDLEEDLIKERLKQILGCLKEGKELARESSCKLIEALLQQDWTGISKLPLNEFFK